MLSSAAESVRDRLNALPANDVWGVEAARLLLEAAAALGCSDLHIACLRDAVVVRGRRQGALVPMARIPIERRDLLIARLKVLARLPAYVRHEPQDGRIEWAPPGVGATRLLRASFLPVLHGENIVIRFPDDSTAPPDMTSLGMPEATYRDAVRLLGAREGAILLTGPSGCGKTTTLHAMMGHLHARHGDRMHFVTIEDPIERDLGFASQVQVNEAQNVTWERALRSALRHDPNVILIGEIRDAETARIAMQAGVTGHLVLSTLHAGRVARVVTRLLSMGIEPYLVASSLAGAVAQRLVRIACAACRDGAPGGCEKCNYTGYSGRSGVFEIGVVTERLREMILARASAAEIAAEIAGTQGGNLADEGRRLLESGTISRAEWEFAFSDLEAAS